MSSEKLILGNECEKWDTFFPKILKSISSVFKKQEKIILTKTEILEEIKNIDWDRHLEDLGLSFEEFKDKVSKMNFKDWELEKFLNKNEPNSQFLKRILEVYGFCKKYDLNKIEKTDFTGLYLYKWKLYWYLHIDISGWYISENFNDNLIIIGNEWVKGDFNHLSFDWKIISFDDDRWENFKKNHFSLKERLKLYVDWKEVITRNFKDKYFEYHEAWISWPITWGGIVWSAYLEDSRYGRHTFLKDKFIADYRAGQVKTKREKTLKYKMWTLD